MSSSSRLHGDTDGSKVELPVFVTPGELVFASNKKRSLLTVFNPYGNEAQFRIMTTSPDRFDVSITKGTIKPSRRVDITIRLINQKIDELPEPSDELQTIDYFRITLQVGPLKGNKPIKVHWCAKADFIDSDDIHLIDEKTSKMKIKKSTSPSASQSVQLGSIQSSQKAFPNQRSAMARPGRQSSQIEPSHGSSNVNLVCTLCAIACVITLFLPLAIDSELCKKVKSFGDQSSQNPGLASQFTSLMSISYEVKLGCSFALGLFTYRLISTLPD